LKLLPETFSLSDITPEDIGRIIVLLLTTTILTAVMTPVVFDSYWSMLSPGSFSAGSEASRSIQAPREYQIEDPSATGRKRNDAVSSLKRIFSHRDSEEELVDKRISKLFASLQEFAGVQKEDPAPVLSLSKEQRTAFERKARIDLVGKEWEVIQNKSNWPKLSSALQALVDPYLVRGIVANKELVDRAIEGNGVLLVRSSTGEERELYGSNNLISYQQASELFGKALSKRTLEGPKATRSLMTKLGLMMIEPNVVVDTVEFEKRASSLRGSIEPVAYTVKRGQFIVRAGDIISKSQSAILAQIRSQHKMIDVIKSVVGYFLLSALIITTVFLFTIKIWPAFKPHIRDLLVVSAVLIGSFLAFKGVRILGDALSYSFPELSSGAILLAAPVAVGGILLEVTLGAPAVFLFAMTFALLTGVFLEEAWQFLLLIIMGNIVGAVSVQHCPRRSQFLVAGLRVALINIVIVLGFVLLEPQSSFADNSQKLFCVTVAGLLSGILAASITPLVEVAGSYITDMKLLELASLDRPLLRELSVQAPGTWNHSVVMGQMAEAAAKAIEAKSLLSRVGAYYHDVGKMKNPAYFIENQTSKENRHDKLAPSMSALIIKAHVKNGVELAEQHKLPRPLVDFIREHHGTSLIEYFYDKALKEAEEDENVDESHYRYAGPRPQTKESGILMLADGVEAASRTLSDPTPAKIQGLVQKMINKVFADGELDESELTLKELHLIAKEFTRILTGIHHRRVEYNEPAGKGSSEPQEDHDSEVEGSERKANLSVVKPFKPPRKNGEKDKDKKQEREDGSGRTGSTDGKRASEEGSDDKPTNGGGKDTLKRLGIEKS